MHDCPRDIGVAGFFAAAGGVGGARAAGSHGFADRHKGGGDVGVAGVVFQTAAPDGVFCLQHHGGFDFRGVFDFPRGREELAHQLENTLADGGRIDADVLHAIFFGKVFNLLGLSGKVHALPLVVLEHTELAPGHHWRRDHRAPGAVAAVGFRWVVADPHRAIAERGPMSAPAAI